MHSKRISRSFALIAVVLLIVAFITFALLQTSSDVVEPHYLLPILNTIFLFLTSCVVAYVAVRSYLVTGSLQILLLGAGVLTFGTGSLFAGWAISKWGPNTTATLHNSALLLAALCHFTGVILSFSEKLPEVDPAQRRHKVFTIYAATQVFIFSLFVLSIKGIMPTFFINGIGPTILRQAVLTTAFFLLLYTSAFMMTRFFWKREPYLYWYSLALTLLVIGIAGIFVQSAVGSHVGWVGRIAQYLAGIYFVVSIMSARREAERHGLSLGEVVAELFLTPGFHWQDILRTALSGFWIADTNGRFLEVNDACCRILGYTRKELLSMTIADVEAVEDPSRVFHHIEVLKEKKTDYFISKHLRKDGTTIDVEVNATYLNIGKGQLAVFFQDITARKRAEEAVKQSEERYRALFNGMTEGFAIHEIITDEQETPTDWRFLDINPAFERLTGLKRDNVVGKTYSEVLPGDDPKWLRMYGAVALTGEPVQFENYSPALKRHYSVLAYRPAPRQFAVIFLDITDRKKVEETLRESERLLKETQAVARLGGWKANPTTDFLIWTAGVYNLIEAPLEYKPSLAEGLKFFAPKYVPILQKHLLLTLETNEPFSEECEVITTSGKRFWVDVRGLASVREDETSYVVGTIQDISGRKQAEEALRDNEERLRAITNHTPDHILMQDLDLRYQLVINPQLGLSEADMLGKTDYEILEHDDAERLTATKRTVLETGDPFTLESSVRNSKGEAEYFAGVYVPKFGLTGQVDGIIGYFRNITKRKHAEMELQERTRQLEAANRELESFSYSVSHDLRAPLRAIDGYSRMILKKQEDRLDKEAKRQFQVIRDNVGKMGKLIDDLLAFSRLGRQEVTRVDLDMEALIRDAWQELITIHPDRKMSLAIGPMPVALGDQTLIRQVFGNLMGNAVKFTKTRETAVIEVGSITKDSETVYYTKDNGIGFDMKFYDKLFGVFQRLHGEEEYEGTGIGLALVHRIIQRHGGRIWAEGKVDEGATFYFTLPIRKE